MGGLTPLEANNIEELYQSTLVVTNKHFMLRCNLDEIYYRYSKITLCHNSPHDTPTDTLLLITTHHVVVSYDTNLSNLMSPALLLAKLHFGWRLD